VKLKDKSKTQLDWRKIGGFQEGKGLTQQALAEVINLHVIQVCATKAASL
jgi:hypothetical protein